MPLKVWRCYLEGSTFKGVVAIITLYVSSSYSAIVVRAKQVVQFLQQFEFGWEYKQGERESGNGCLTLGFIG
jgi:hypothetical protein